jgi:tetratricopeptide (TPR) repeat protein
MSYCTALPFANATAALRPFLAAPQRWQDSDAAFDVPRFGRSLVNDFLAGAVISACLALAAAPANAQFPGGVTPPGQPRYKPKPDAPRPGVNAQSQRWYEGALQEYNAKRYGTAMSMIERSIAADANNPSAWYLRGAILHMGKDRAGALAAYNRTLAIDPRYGKAYGDRALLYEQMGRKALAAADWARMRALR